MPFRQWLRERAGCLARFAMQPAKLGHAGLQVGVETLYGSAVAFSLQAQTFDEGIGEGAMMQIVDFIGKLGCAARRDSHGAVLTLKTGHRSVTGTQVPTGIEKQNDISRAAFFQLLDHVSYFDPGSGDIARIRVKRKQIIHVTITASMSGEEEPKIVGCLQEGMLEALPHKTEQIADRGSRLEWWTDIAIDQRRIFRQLIHFFEPGILSKERGYPLRILPGVAEGRDIVILVDADRYCPVFAHGVCFALL
ncbi:hypothetical protein D3C80_1166600 [compost metagenome]